MSQTSPAKQQEFTQSGGHPAGAATAAAAAHAAERDVRGSPVEGGEPRLGIAPPIIDTDTDTDTDTEGGVAGDLRQESPQGDARAGAGAGAVAQGSTRHADTPDEEPAFTVVDRRFWARSSKAERDAAADAVADAAASAATHQRKPTYVAQLEEKLAAAEARVRDTLEQHRAAKSEFENARARLQRDIAREIEAGKRRIISELLEVVDNLERAIGAAQDNDDPRVLRDGVALVHAQFATALGNLGVRKLSSVGQRFDPRRHEAVSAIPVTERERDGEIVGVIKECYVMGDDTLRPGMVAVAKGPDA